MRAELKKCKTDKIVEEQKSRKRFCVIVLGAKIKQKYPCISLYAARHRGKAKCEKISSLSQVSCDRISKQG